MPRKKPGPVALSQDVVNQATKTVLRAMTTFDGEMPFDEWLMNLTAGELEKLPLDAWKRTTEGWAVFQPDEDQERFEVWATRQQQKLYDFKSMRMGQLHDLVGESVGPNRARLERASMNLVRLRNELEHFQDKSKIQKVKRQIEKLERGDFKYTGGNFHRWVMEAKDEFLIWGCFTWRQTPPALRNGHQPGIPRDAGAFWQRCEDSINMKLSPRR
jgi:hypothetical protein